MAASRNDGHGGHLRERMQLFIDGLSEQANRAAAATELLLVEWNPPADAPSLEQSLDWSRTRPWLVPRIITIGADVHKRFARGTPLAFFQMIAKNAGIRRARAKFVLATNIDILLSDELFDIVISELDQNTLYRADRIDVGPDYETGPSPSACRALAPIRIHRREGTVSIAGAQAGATARRSALDRALRRAAALRPRSGVPSLHTNACGDFTLLSRTAWDALRGYPEWPLFSWRIDGVLLYQAAGAGLAMVDLAPPAVAFHLEHGAGSGWTPEAGTALFRRLDSQGIPYLRGSEYRRIVRSLVRHELAPSGFNQPDWGLASEELRDRSPAPS